MAPSLAPALESRLQVLRVLWLAQVASVGIFTAVCFVLGQSTTTGADGVLLGWLRRSAVILALAFVLVSNWWRRSFARSRANPVALPVDEAGGPYTVEHAAVILGRLQVNCVIVWTLSEAVAIVGLVLGIVARDVMEFLPFAAVAVVLLYLHRPAAWPLQRISRAIGS